MDPRRELGIRFGFDEHHLILLVLHAEAKRARGGRLSILHRKDSEIFQRIAVLGE